MMSTVWYRTLVYFNKALTSLVAQIVKNLPAVWETQVQSLDQKIPWRRAWQPTPVFLPGEFHGQRSLQSMGSQRVRHDWATNTFTWKLKASASTYWQRATQQHCITFYLSSDALRRKVRKGGTKISLAPKKIETLGLYLSRQGNLPQEADKWRWATADHEEYHTGTISMNQVRVFIHMCIWCYII